MKRYKLTKYYDYAEFYMIEAESIEEAKKIANSYEWNEDPYDKYEEFNFETMELMDDDENII